MASTNGRESSKKTSSVDSLKLSSKASMSSSKHASSESILSKKEKESLQMQECKKKLLAMEPQNIIIRDDNVVLTSPPQKKIVMPPTINPEELAAATPTQRNWRGILIALLVIGLVLALIVFSIALLTPGDTGARFKGRRPTLAELLDLQYQPLNATWVSDEELVYRDRWGGLTLFHVRNLTTTLLLNNSTFRELNAVDYKVSADLKFVLLVSDVRPGWRHARLARYHVYDILNRNKVPVSPVEEDRAAPLLQHAEWAPAGAGLVFVHDNDVYYKPRARRTLVCRITNNGVPGVVFNGVPDFLYETEVLRLERALWFSPDSQALMFLTYNDSMVHQHRYPWYGLNQPEPPAYPTIRSVRYPKMNTNNPEATLNVVSLKTLKYLFPHAIQFPPDIDKTWYIRWSSWVSERELAVLLLNRAQNVSVLARCSATQYNCVEIYRETAVGRWAGLGAEPEGECGWCGGVALLAGGGAVFTTAPDRPAAADQKSWRHVVRITNTSRDFLTSGNYEITQLVAWDEKRKLLYVMGTAPGQAGDRHLYRVTVPEPGVWPAPPDCLTCGGGAGAGDAGDAAGDDAEQEQDNTTMSVSSWPSSTVLPHVADNSSRLPDECLYNRVMFSHNYSYYVQECLGPGVPAVLVCSRSGSRVSVLDSGAALRERWEQLAAPEHKVFRVEVQHNREARVRLWLPPGLRETDDLPLPLLLTVSGEPGEQLVTSSWLAAAGGAAAGAGGGAAGGAGSAARWAAYLAAARSFIVAEIDARGAPGQGEEMRTEIYQKLFTIDVEDQIAVLTYLRDNLKMVDGARVAVWGRGAGGGAALALAAQDARNLTRCVAAAAPVTHAAHRASLWAERWAGGAGGAGAGAAWRRACNLPPRRVLLLHGSADVRALPTHALLMARALVAADAPYTHQIYPDEGHELRGSAPHVYATLERFLDDCFGPVDVDVAAWDQAPDALFPFRD